MIFTRKSFVALQISLVLLALSVAHSMGLLNGWMQFLDIKKNSGEIAILCVVFGMFGFLASIYAYAFPRRPGRLDQILGTVSGINFVMILSMFVIWIGEPLVTMGSQYLSKTYQINILNTPIHEVAGINHIMIGIIIGIVIRNVFGVPAWAQHGIRISRMILKSGVILLGTQYSLTAIYRLGSAAFITISIFTIGTVFLVLLVGARYRMSNSMTGVMASGLGVCGVSATIAAAPVVNAKSSEIAYTVATILVWGLICMLTFPFIGHLVDLNSTQFGAWAGTGILNSAQVLAAAQAFDSTGGAVETAATFNLTRVLFLPLIVLILAVWFVQRDNAMNPREMNMGDVLVNRFPIFILGFIFMFALNTQGVFLPKNHVNGKYFSNKIDVSKLLTDAEAEVLQIQLDEQAVKLDRQKQAIENLIKMRKIMSESDEIQLKGLKRSRNISAQTKQILDKALNSVRHASKKLKMVKQVINWLFTFGLVGLSLQITFRSIFQAGGTPLFLGCVIGTIKAAGSLIIIYYAIDATIA